MNTDRRVRYWNKSAAGYDSMISRLEPKYLTPSRRWIGERVTGEVLEVAIGTGASLMHYPQGVALTGVDWSPEMLRHAQHRADSLGINATLQVADAARLPFPDASFDTVVSQFAMCSVPDLDAAMSEMSRVLRPRGTLLLADHVASTSWWVRLGQYLLNAVTILTQGDHWTRRPAKHLARLGLEVAESQRSHHGLIEHLAATSP